jgi:hypothetical protein
VVLVGQHTQTKHYRRIGRILANPVARAERGKPFVASTVDKVTREGHPLPQKVKDAGTSERRPVIGRIGDETIAPARKRADFRRVAYR